MKCYLYRWQPPPHHPEKLIIIFQENRQWADQDFCDMTGLFAGINGDFLTHGRNLICGKYLTSAPATPANVLEIGLEEKCGPSGKYSALTFELLRGYNHHEDY